jgi:capsular exopolysaccharide synthesis family protein
MLRYARSEDMKLVAVVSQGPQEGKSFAAANLALALSKSGKRTLLIDCDLHRPNIDRMFDVERAPGLAEFLTRQATYDQCLTEVDGESLSLITAGGRVPDPSELVSSPRFNALLQQCRARFQAVVLDTPPVLAVSEVLDIARVVDGIVMVARAEQTNRFALAEAADRLRRIQAPLVGLIVNGVESGSGGGAFGGYYYKYYAYDYKSDDEGRGRKTKAKR